MAAFGAERCAVVSVAFGAVRPVAFRHVAWWVFVSAVQARDLMVSVEVHGL